MLDCSIIFTLLESLLVVIGKVIRNNLKNKCKIPENLPDLPCLLSVEYIIFRKPPMVVRNCNIFDITNLKSEIHFCISSEPWIRDWLLHINKILAHVFYYEFCKIFKNNFLTEHLRPTDSNLTTKHLTPSVHHKVMHS